MNIAGILSSIFNNIVPFTILLGILVFVHELGHFLVARMCGVRVEVFSLGFGKKILQYKRGDTNYCISLIPLGGYVKMFGEQPGADISDEDKKVAFTHKTVWQRIAVVLAGPLMNFFFAVLVFAFIFWKGEETRSARIADVQPQSVAETAGLKTQDKVISVNSNSGTVETPSYEVFQKTLNQHIGETVSLNVQQDNESPRTVSVSVSSQANPNIFSLNKTIGTIEGVLPYAKGSLVAVRPGTLAYKSGLRTGDEILRINAQKVLNWKTLELLAKNTSMTVDLDRMEDGKKKTVTLQTLADSSKTIASIDDFGLEHPDLYLDQVVKDSPAEKADLKRGDKITAINGTPITAWDQVLQTIKSYDGKDAITMTIQREGTELLKKLTPQITSQMTMQGKEDKRYTVGIISMVNIAQPELITIAESNPIVALGKGTARAWDISVITVMSFVRMFQGEVSHKNIGGMISIGKAAKDSYEMGLQAFLMTMGILSISLFILNLLPVPVLDGGHLVFYGIELVKGSPLSIRKMEIAHQVGFALLMGLMVLALFNDFTKFLF